MRYLIVVLFAGVLILAGCDTAKDSAKATEKGSKGAVGIAEKMSQGTVGGADENSSDDSSSSGE
jgi:hypothetical protein